MANKWFYSRWFVLASLFLVLGPFGLPLLWRSPSFSRTQKIIWSVIFVAYMIALVWLPAKLVGDALHSFERAQG